ncbi:MAG: hypothetical protein ACUVRX_11195 [Actinomycetota bacterium]
MHDCFPDVREVQLVWHYLVFDKELRSKRTPEQLGALKDEVIWLIHEIENTEEFEARESALCEWCGYQDICPKRKRLYVVESLPPREFKEDEGVVLADRYIALKEEENRIREEIEKVKLELWEYAEQMGVEAVRGSDAVLLVKKVMKPGFPFSGSRERAALEALCRELGRLEEVSALSAPRLAKVVTERAWEESELARIEPYVTWNESIEVRKRKATRIEEPD